MNSLKNKLPKSQESKLLIKNLKRNPAKIKKIKSKKSKIEIVQLKIDTRGIDEKCLQFYGLVKKTREKLDFHKSANVKRKIDNMGQLMDIEKVNEFAVWIVKEIKHIEGTLKDPRPRSE